jgi:hypothetical protein
MSKEEVAYIIKKFDELPKNELTAVELVTFLKENHILMPINTIKAIIVLSDENDD